MKFTKRLHNSQQHFLSVSPIYVSAKLLNPFNQYVIYMGSIVYGDLKCILHITTNG